MWRVSGSMINIVWDRSTHSWWKEKIASPISKIDDFMEHVYREHNWEADHWTNTGAQRLRKIVLDRCDNSETWKAAKGYSVGSFKDNGKSGGGVVIKGRQEVGDT